jgi:hypothetical protein
MFRLFILCCILFTPGILLAQSVALPIPTVAPGYALEQYIGEPSLWGRFVSEAPSWLISLVPLFIMFSFACRFLAELLFFIKDKTPTEVDNKVYAILLKLLDVLANVFGAIGVNMPKAMVLAKADAIAVKEEAKTVTEPVK